MFGVDKRIRIRAIDFVYLVCEQFTVILEGLDVLLISFIC